jgi:hypothetical protein
MTREAVTMLVMKALREGPFSMRQLADAEGLSYGVLRAWSMGRRTPEPENLRRLAEGFRNRASALQELAAELEGAAGEQ